MSEILCTITDIEHDELNTTIIEVEGLDRLIKDLNAQKETDKEIINSLIKSYTSAVVKHKIYWQKILRKYVDSKTLGEKMNLLRYDVSQKVIFIMDDSQCSCGH